METIVRTYNSEGSMKTGIRKMEGLGWRVLSTQVISEGRGSGACCLFLILMPLAFLAKPRKKYQVTYQK